ncbi:hypothetical protein FSP39_003002 [Pinctada imbricata]|uniref:Elongation factor Ts, mitochondrial n=1 Tax=Pinctada imbricata TaxID=66713 RepID=A0AA89BPG5_PINIB|nr:hypothetical protein FSP39_003002 [Pinctada imbricata]
MRGRKEGGRRERGGGRKERRGKREGREIKGRKGGGKGRMKRRGKEKGAGGGDLLKLPMQRFALLSMRQYASSVNKEALKELRNRTGVAFVNCKKALEKFDNNIDEATQWLEEQAQKEGWAKVAKVKDRPMSQGLVGVVTTPDCATVVEVNCETDFVAKNQKFQELVARLTQVCHEHFSEHGTNASYSRGALNLLKDNEDKSLADLVALEVGSMGENMLLRRGMFHKASVGNTLATYVHNIGPSLQIDEVKMGKFATTVEVSPVAMGADPDADIAKVKRSKLEEGTEDGATNVEGSTEIAKPNEGELSSDSDSSDSSDSEDEFEAATIDEVANKVCLHVMGINPKDVGVPNESTPSMSKSEEQTLIYQDFLCDDSMTVGKYLYRNGYSIMKFTRYECGEEIEGEELNLEGEKS